MRGVWKGEGRAVALLHGQPGSGRDWDLVTARLPRLRVLAPDRPGYDGTPARDFAANAAGLAELAHANGVTRLVVVGHSWGGGVAIALATDHPDLVAGLCLVGSVGSPLAVSRADVALSLPGLGRLAGLAVCATAVAAPRAFVAGTGSRLPSNFLPEIRRTGIGWLQGRAAPAFAAEQRYLVTQAQMLEQRASRIAVPALVVTGERDRSVSPAAAADLAARLPRGRLLTLPGGHLLPWEAPDAVAEAIRRCVADAFW